MKKKANSDAAAGQRTICQHVDVIQPDGSIARFHCRVPVAPQAPSQIGNAEPQAGVTVTWAADVNAQGLLKRIWCKWVGNPRATIR